MTTRSEGARSSSDLREGRARGQWRTAPPELAQDTRTSPAGARSVIISGMTEPAPTLRLMTSPDQDVSSAVLVLHGGREHGSQPTSRAQLSYLRMLDFTWGLRKHTSAAAVYLLRYRVRGWNPGQAVPDPVVDAGWALDQIQEQHPGVPVAMLGHSMGGRTAFAVADRPDVVGVCGLAPWLPEAEPLPGVHAGQRFVIAHGTSDRMTSSPLSRLYAERMRHTGHQVARFELPGARHAMLDRPALWHQFSVRTTLGLVGDGPLPPGVEIALRQTGTGRFDRALNTFDATA